MRRFLQQHREFYRRNRRSYDMPGLNEFRQVAVPYLDNEKFLDVYKRQVARLVQGRQQHRRQYRYDCDHNEQLNKSEQPYMAGCGGRVRLVPRPLRPARCRCRVRDGRQAERRSLGGEGRFAIT